jgi:phage N-6-adenine-methyltransferase
MTAVHVSTESRQDHATPPALVQEIGESFGVTFLLDLAASEENTKCERYLRAEEDGLSVDWHALLLGIDPIGWAGPRPAAWINPPYRGVDPWMEKCKVESAKGCRIVSLTLASLGTAWYRNHVEGSALSLILRKRVTFLGQPTSFPKELMITLWGFGMTGLGFWDPSAKAVR